MQMNNNKIVISTEKLSVAFEDRIVLKDITFQIRHGEFWGILGPNGSGKTTLIRTLLGLVKPIAGNIRIFGYPPDKLGARRELIGYVPQHSQVDFDFPITVKDVIMLGRSGKIGVGRRPGRVDFDAVKKSLEFVNLVHLADRQIGRISGGERQRVLIARALALEPQILFLDEPTAALDVGAADSFYEWLNKMRSSLNITLVIVSHDVGVISRYVNKIACLNQTLVVHGIPEKVLNKENLEKMYGCEAVFFHHGKVPHIVVSEPQQYDHLKGKKID